MVRGLLSGLALVAVMAIAGSAEAAVRYAAPNGDGGAGKCKRQNPCDIQDAVGHSSVADGDEVIVLPGTYVLAAPVRIQHAIEVHGNAARRHPRLIGDFGGGSTVLIEGGAGAAEVHHLRISKEAGGAISAGSGHVHDVTAQANEVSEAILYGQDEVGASNGVVIERVVARGPSPAACIPPLAPGVIRDSVCHATGTSGYGIEIYPSQGGNYEVRNVTAIGPDGGILARAQDSEDVNLDALNVIADGPVIDVQAQEIGVPAEVDIDLSSSNYGSISQINGATITAPGAGTNQTEPFALADPEGGDYAQLAGSPTRNAGTLGLLGRFDFHGQLRTQEGAPDIGADEFDTGLKLRVKAKRLQPGSPVKLKVKCPKEACSVKAKGKLEAGGDKLKLRPARAFLSAGESAGLKLGSRDDVAGTAKVKVRAVDGGGSAAVKRKTIRVG